MREGKNSQNILGNFLYFNSEALFLTLSLLSRRTGQHRQVAASLLYPTSNGPLVVNQKNTLHVICCKTRNQNMERDLNPCPARKKENGMENAASCLQHPALWAGTGWHVPQCCHHLHTPAGTCPQRKRSAMPWQVTLKPFTISFRSSSFPSSNSAAPPSGIFSMLR